MKTCPCNYFSIFLQTSSWFTISSFLTFIIVSIGVLTAMYDRWKWVPVAEAARCAAFIIYARNIPVTPSPIVDSMLVLIHVASLFLWANITIGAVKTRVMDPGLSKHS